MVPNPTPEPQPCALCGGLIQAYLPAFHHLVLDEHHEVDLCQACIDKFMRWQATKFATLFPTKALKKRFGAG